MMKLARKVQRQSSVVICAKRLKRYRPFIRTLLGFPDVCSPHICRQERRDDSRQSVECFDTNPLLYLLPTRLIPETLFKKSIFYFKKNFLILQKYRTNTTFLRIILDRAYISNISFTRGKSKLYLFCATKFLTLIFPFEKKNLFINRTPIIKIQLYRRELS